MFYSVVVDVSVFTEDDESLEAAAMNAIDRRDEFAFVKTSGWSSSAQSGGLRSGTVTVSLLVEAADKRSAEVTALAMFSYDYGIELLDHLTTEVPQPSNEAMIRYWQWAAAIEASYRPTSELVL